MSVLVADPPWRFNDRLPGPKRGAEKHYATMSIEELVEFPLPKLEKNSVLFMWRVASLVPEAYRLVDAWGFTAKSELVWKKTTKKGKRHFGMGHYVRMEHESCIIATRGSALPKIQNVRSVFEAPVGAHSAKPDAFYELVEQLYDGPYFELFARRPRVGWTCFGDELEEKEDEDDVER